MRGAALALLLVTNCTKPGHVPRTDDAPPLFLWKVTRPGADGELFLFGTAHLERRDYGFDRAVREAFLGAHTLVVEVDVSDSGAMQEAMRFGLYPNDTSLEAQVSAETFALVRAKAEALRLPLETVQRLRPWVVPLVFLAAEQAMPRDGGVVRTSEHGLDGTFFNLALANDLRIDTLEQPSDQLKLLSAGTDAEHEAALRESLTQDASASLDALVKAYEAGDTEALARATESDDPAAQRRLDRIFTERNTNWVQVLWSSVVKPGRTFAAVGAAHLVGRSSVLELFKEKGFQVERVAPLGSPQPLTMPRRVTSAGGSVTFDVPPEVHRTEPRPGTVVTAFRARTDAGFFIFTATDRGGEPLRREDLFVSDAGLSFIVKHEAPWTSWTHREPRGTFMLKVAELDGGALPPQAFEFVESFRVGPPATR